MVPWRTDDDPDEVYVNELSGPLALAVVAAEAADDKKATDLVVLEVGGVLKLVDLFVLATASNERQLDAISDAVQERLREVFGRRALHREGDPASGWILLDYGEVVYHLFSAEQRSFYELERLWSDVPRRDPWTGEVLEPGAEVFATSREHRPVAASAGATIWRPDRDGGRPA